MVGRLLFLGFFLCWSFVFSQNSEIKNAAGTLLDATTYFCPGERFSLQVDDYYSTGTSSWHTEPINNFNDLISLTTGEVNVPFSAATRNNVFSLPINLGFNFTFFGKTYTRAVVGTNGRIVFTNASELDNLHNESVFIDRTFSSTGEQLPTTDYNQVYKNAPTDRELPLAQIFASFTNLRSNTLSTVYKYKPFDNGTTKGIVFTFQNVIAHNGIGGDYGSFFTSRVIIFEDGRVVINVLDKTYSTYNAILGMQNETATEFIIPDHSDTVYNYNNRYWTSESGTAFVFNTAITRTPSYQWQLDQDSDGSIEQTSSSRFFPSGSASYVPTEASEKLHVDITFSESGVATRNSVVDFVRVDQPIITKSISGCDVILKIDPATYNSALRYEWYRTGSATPVSTSNQQQLILNASSAPGDYFVKVFKPDGTLCSQSTTVNFSGTIPASLKKTSLTICDNSAAPATTHAVNLYNEFYVLYDSATNYETYDVEFSDAFGIIADPENYTLPANQTKIITLKVRLRGQTVDCINQSVTLNFISSKTAESIDVCASVTGYNLENYFESGKPSAFNYQYTYADGTAVTDPTNVDVTKPVDIKTNIAGSSCTTITRISFNIGAGITVPKVPVQERCAGADTNPNRFDFNHIKSIVDPQDLYDVKFYRESDHTEIIPTSSATGDNLNLAGYFWTNRMGEYYMYVRLYNRSDPSCYGESERITLWVYPRPSYDGDNPIQKQNCAGNSIFDLTSKFDFSNLDTRINPTIRYYNASGTELTGTDITQYDTLDHSGMPYVIVQFNPSCFSTKINFVLTFNPLPVAATKTITVCEETNYSLTDFQTKVLPGSSADYELTDQNGNPLPATIDIAARPTIRVYIINKTTGCKSELTDIKFVKGAPTSVNAAISDFVKCDVDGDLFDGKTSFNLLDWAAQITPAANPEFEFYTSPDRSAASRISNPESFTNTNSTQIIYGRVTTSTTCPTDFQFILKVNIPTISTTLEPVYYICFGETITIDAGAENVEWEWSDGQSGRNANFTAPGNYSVKLTNSDGCSYTHSFVISDENQPIIGQINQNEQQIEVIANGKYPIEYSFDNGLSWDLSNILLNPVKLQYNIRVRSVLPDASYCEGEGKSIYTIVVPNYMTPNGDGKNDTWFIQNLDKMDAVEVIVSDRYGKSVYHSTDKNDTVWDGKRNGRVLPTATYWYVVKWYDPATLKNEIRQGWILLKNRN